VSKLSKAMSLLEELAPEHVITDDEFGYCVFCTGFADGKQYVRSERFIEDHEEWCPWVEARKLMGDRIPSRRTHGN